MWCQRCRQHVAANVAPHDGEVRCARCRSPLAGSLSPVMAAAGPPMTDAHADAFAIDRIAPPHEPLLFSAVRSWEMDEDLRHVGRMLAADQPQDPGGLPSLEELFCAPLPPAWQPPTDNHDPPARESSETPARRSKHQSPLIEMVSGAALYLGAMALSCGAALVAWSQSGGHPDLWKVGLPGGVAGLGGLLIALACGGRRGQTDDSPANDDSRVVSRNSSGNTTRLPANPPSMARHISAPK
jgi:hypothetical protein